MFSGRRPRALLNEAAQQVDIAALSVVCIRAERQGDWQYL
jgi:hypothetical protein